MIETSQDFLEFMRDNESDDLFLHVVPEDDSLHPKDTSASVIFVRNLRTPTTYYIAKNHPDFCGNVEIPKFVDVLMTSCKGKKWALDKKSVEQLLPICDVCDVNLAGYLTDNTIIDTFEYQTPAHYLVKKNSMGHRGVNLAIPLNKHLEVFNEMSDDAASVIKNFKPDESFSRFNDYIIGTLGRVEEEGIFVDRDKFLQRFHIDVGARGLAYSQYNVYTSTGRPSNRFGGVNYAALNQHDGSRTCFRSRYGEDGRIVIIDYTAFHPRIICALTDYPMKKETDIYNYLGKLYFHKKDIDETDIKNAKQITFRQLYGGVEDQYAHIKYLSNLKTFINEQWQFFQENGYVLTPFFKRKITSHHIQDPSPTKVFNYILQAVEGEIAIPRLKEVQEYLKDKKTKAILYTYDAVLYDFHKDDGFEVLKKIRSLMSFNDMFPMKTYIGETYQDVKLMDI